MHIIAVYWFPVKTDFEEAYSEHSWLSNMELVAKVVQGYLRYNTITSQNVPSKAQINNFFIL